jgi:hypothetical protein
MPCNKALLEPTSAFVQSRMDVPLAGVRVQHGERQCVSRKSAAQIWLPRLQLAELADAGPTERAVVDNKCMGFCGFTVRVGVEMLFMLLTAKRSSSLVRSHGTGRDRFASIEALLRRRDNGDCIRE